MDRANSISSTLLGGQTHPHSPVRANTVTYYTPEPAPMTGADTRPGANARRRKETILSLIDEISLFRDEDLGDVSPAGYQPQAMFDEKLKDTRPHVNERLQTEGAETFYRFDKRIKGLDRELQNFANAVRQLGSSVGLVSSAYHLRARLNQVLHLFRENAVELFDKVKKENVEPVKPFTLRKRNKSRQLPTTKVRPSIPLHSDPEMLPKELKHLATDLTTFLKCLNDIPEFTDEAVNASVLSFEGDLKYWASSLTEFEGQFRYPAVEGYVNDLTVEMGEHLENIMTALTVFVETGVPTIRHAQSHTASGLQNLSTVATFFSAVTATTLQYSYQGGNSGLNIAVNLFWVSSLVFSLASAINSQLAFHWRAAMYRSPRVCVPWWVSIWITRTPLFFLVISVISFSAGLVCFTFFVFAHTIIPLFCAIWTSISSFALLAVALWFASERWAFSKTKGRKWLADVLSEFWRDSKQATGINWVEHHVGAKMTITGTWVKRQGSAAGGHVASAGRALYRVSSRAIGSGIRIAHLSSDEESGRGELPFNNSGSFPDLSSTVSSSPVARRNSDHNRLFYPSSPPKTETIAEEGRPRMHRNGSAVVPEPPVSPARRRFQAIVSDVMRKNRTTKGFGIAEVPRVPSSPILTEHRGRRDSIDPMPLRPSRLATIVPALRNLTPSLSLNEHQALVRHLQFSPSGKFLATASWDRKAIIWKVGETFEIHRQLAHPTGHVGQVAWSPNGELLLTKTSRLVKVWTEAGVCKRTIDRRKPLHAVTWLPSGERIVLVEGTEHGTDVHFVDLSGTSTETFRLDRLTLHDAAVTPDRTRIVAVGTLLKSCDGLIPAKSRAEKRIIVYNLHDRAIENQVPVLQDVRDITLSSNGLLALVSYENKAPPQVWRLSMVREQARLILHHTYMPSSPVDFAGPSYFAGKEEQFVFCAGKGGEVHIWDRETGFLLHSIKAQEQSSDLTAIAWNHAYPSLMFASAAHDGTVRIWTAQSPGAPPGYNNPTTPALGWSGARMVDSPGDIRPGMGGGRGSSFFP